MEEIAAVYARSLFEVAKEQDKLNSIREQLGSFLAPLGSVQSVSDIDGLRTTLADGRVIHFRPSGNAPEMRCYVEAADKESAASLLKDGLSLLERWSA